MYAVIQTGGKQYRVSEGMTLKVEKIDADEGASIELDKVLLVADGDEVKVGTPYLEGAVTATVKSRGKGRQVGMVKFTRRKDRLKRRGRRREWWRERRDAPCPRTGRRGRALTGWGRWPFPGA